MLRFLRILRALPALALAFTQIAMAGSVVPARAEAPELVALAALLQVDEVSLCNAGLDRDGATAIKCPWCQGFGQAALPSGPALAQCDDCRAVTWGMPYVAQTDLAPAGLDYVSRAPPA